MNSLLLQSGSFWMPPKASTHVRDVDPLFHFILWLSVFFFLLIMALMVVFILKYRYRKGQQTQPSPSHNTRLELVWTIIPTVLVVIIFYWGFRGYLHMSVMPPDPYEVQVTARAWVWNFTYPNGHTDDVLHVPVNTPIRLVLRSEDVIHSLFIPAFRVKKDAVPGRYNRFWFEATQIGEYDIYCAEYCGTQHSTMLSKVVVHTPDEFRAWLAEADKWETRMSPVQAGEMLFTRRGGCTQCHSLDGSSNTGPTLKDVFGSQVRLDNGQTVLADENYIRESILEPNAKVVAGFQPVMNSYKGIMKDKDIDAIIWFLKSKSRNYSGSFPEKLATTQPTTQAQKPEDRGQKTE